MQRFAVVWKRFAESVTVVAFAIMVAGFVIGIGSRYVFNAPVAWANELCLIAYLWVTFWCSAILLDERQHIVFDVLYNALGRRPKRWAAIFITLSLAVVFIAALPGTFNYLEFLHSRRSTTMHLPMQFVFGGFLVFNLAAVISALIRLVRLLRPGWEKYL